MRHIKAGILDYSMFRQWLIDKKALADGSVDEYCRGVHRFLRGSPDIHSMDSYNEFIIAQCIKNRSYQWFRAVKLYIEFKITDRILKETLLTNLIRPKLQDPKTSRITLTEEKKMDIINGLKSDVHRMMAIIQNITGIRSVDVLRCRRDHIYDDVINGEKVLRIDVIGKGGKRNPIYIFNPSIIAAIKNFIAEIPEEEQYIFLHDKVRRKRKVFSLRDIDSLQYRYKRGYQLYVRDMAMSTMSNGIVPRSWSTHDFRRSYAKTIWNKYKDIDILKRLLCHSNVETTIRYLRNTGLQNVDVMRELQMGDTEEKK